MRRSAKIKASNVSAPLRKAALSASSAARRPFPAWIDASEGGVAFPARSAMPRVRDGLVLRLVARKKSGKTGSNHDGRRAQ